MMLQKIVKTSVVGLLDALFVVGYFYSYWALERALCVDGGFFSNGCYEWWSEPLFIVSGILLLVLLIPVHRFFRFIIFGNHW